MTIKSFAIEPQLLNFSPIKLNANPAKKGRSASSQQVPKQLMANTDLD